MSAHPDVVELVDYARGVLVAERARRLRDHCTACAECGDQLAALLLLQPSARHAAPGRAAKFGRVAAAVGLLAVILAGWWIVTPGSQPAAPPTPGTGTSHLEGSLAALIWTVDVQMGSTESAAAGGRSPDAAIVESVVALRSEDFAAADAAAVQAGDDGLAALLQGVARLHGGDPMAALAPLEQALDTLDGSGETAYAHAARLYLAEALLRSGRAEEASLHLAMLADSSGEPDLFEEVGARRLESLPAPDVR